MRIVFLGSSQFGLRCLKLIGELQCCTVEGVITAPSNFDISYRPEGFTNVLHADFELYCSKNRLNCEVMRSGMKDARLLAKAQCWRPQVFLVVGWYHMIPKSWRELAPAYGLHASLLPDYSGGAPLVWAMINGEKKTGITLFKMDDGVDSGPIAGQAQEPIHDDDTIASLYKRIEGRGLELLARYLPELADGTLELCSQDESRRRIFPQRRPEDGLIDWNLDSHFIERFVRAQTRPYPGAYTVYRGRRIMIWKCRIGLGSVTKRLEAGEIHVDYESVTVGTRRGLIELEKWAYDRERKEPSRPFQTGEKFGYL